MRKKAAIERNARYTARIQRSAWESAGISTAERTRAAPSNTAPAAITQKRCGCGERKNDSAASDVWLSSRSTNQISQAVHNSPNWSNRFRRVYRLIISTAEGGEPARTSSIVTAASRRENAA